VLVFLLTQNIQRMHASLAGHVTAYNMTKRRSRERAYRVTTAKA